MKSRSVKFEWLHSNVQVAFNHSALVIQEECHHLFGTIHDVQSSARYPRKLSPRVTHKDVFSVRIQPNSCCAGVPKVWLNVPMSSGGQIRPHGTTNKGEAGRSIWVIMPTETTPEALVTKKDIFRQAAQCGPGTSIDVQREHCLVVVG